MRKPTERASIKPRPGLWVHHQGPLRHPPGLLGVATSRSRPVAPGGSGRPPSDRLPDPWSPHRGGPFARAGSRFTRDFEDLVGWLATTMDKTALCRLVRIGWDTTGRIIERVMETCLLYTSPSPRDRTRSRMPSSA